MNISVSVIIPVYNSGRYLRDALDGVCNQTLCNIEIICVDDGSSDGSADILNEFAKRDSRIKLLSQQNKGAGAARNQGLSIAAGKYLSFLDSDDLFEPQMLETAYNEAEQYNTDILAFGADNFSSETGKLLPSDYILRKELIPAKDVFSVCDISDRVFTFSYNVAWNKLYRKDFINKNKFRFQEIFSSNDILFACSALATAKRIRCITSVLLHYRNEVAGQLSHSFRITLDNWPMLKAFEETYEFISKLDCFNDIIQDFTDWSLEYLISFLRRSGNADNPEFKQIITEYWIPKLGKTRQKFNNNLDFLFYNEYLTHGYIKRFFENPYVAVKPEHEMTQFSIASGDKVVLYGAGAVGTDYYLQLGGLVAWIDSNAEALFRQGFPIVAPEAVVNMEFDYVLIAVLFKKAAHEIRNRLLELGVPREKIRWTFESKEKAN